jgi:DNA processing protein
VDARAFSVVLTMVPGIGPAAFRRLLEQFGEAEAAWRARPAELASVGLERKTLEALLLLRERLDPEREWERLQALGLQVLALDDPEYPAALREIADPPPLLFVKGTLEPVDRWSVAIVGTRRATAYGRQATERLAADLAAAGVTVVSGLARGIDTYAHRAALQAGGRTIAVLGNGLDTVYPPENRALAAEIAAQGALVTEFPLGVRPDAVNFPRRNRIVAGLCVGTLVVEAGETSGALITADFALEQGRDVFAVPGSIFSQASAGCHQLIRDGARPVTCAQDVLEELNMMQAVQQQEVARAVPTDPIEEELLRHLSLEPQHIDLLSRSVALPMATISSTLTVMELKGLVRHVGGMQYVRGRA